VPRRHPLLARSAFVAVVAGGVLTAVAAPALAHVTVNPKAVPGGSYSQLTFRAPNEEAKAAFTKLTIHLPADHPLGSVSTRPLPGWTASLTTAKLDKPITTDDGTVTEYTNTVTWTATDGGIAPEQYQNFDVSVGPLPDTGTMTFSADQFYANGTVVHWDEVAKAGAAEPDHPAPVLTLTAATTAADTTVTTKSSSDGVARGLGIAGLAVAVVAGGAAIVIARRRTA
jgi:periplasmic copper chaperone A